MYQCFVLAWPWKSLVASRSEMIFVDFPWGFSIAYWREMGCCRMLTRQHVDSTGFHGSFWDWHPGMDSFRGSQLEPTWEVLVSRMRSGLAKGSGVKLWDWGLGVWVWRCVRSGLPAAAGRSRPPPFAMRDLGGCCKSCRLWKPWETCNVVLRCPFVTFRRVWESVKSRFVWQTQYF